MYNYIEALNVNIYVRTTSMLRFSKKVDGNLIDDPGKFHVKW